MKLSSLSATWPPPSGSMLHLIWSLLLSRKMFVWFLVLATVRESPALL